jgi:hypothetical protein
MDGCPSISKMCAEMLSDKNDLIELEPLLDEIGVEWMLYESGQDAEWIRFFSNHPGWEQVSNDQETVLFRRIHHLISEG